MKVLKSMNKRILAIFLALAMVVTGLYVFVPEAEKAQAAGSDTLFAGYYEDAEKTIPVEVETPYEKSIDAGVLSVKLQMKDNADGSYDMRVISSVDSLNYQNVGFEVYYNDAKEPIVFETTAVLERISATAGVTYQYSPKVINTDSEYFVTGTIKGIAAKNLDVNFYIKPFLTTLDGTVVYGQSRYLTVNDGVSNTNINIPVKMDSNPGTSLSVSVGGTNVTAEVAAYKDGYAHLNIPVTDKTALKSATTITGGAEPVVYRNLLSTGSADTSWYDEYKNDTNEFVIANKADLLGLQEVIKATNLQNTTIYTIADIEVNDVTKANWKTGAVASGYTPTQWIPVGRTGSPYWNCYFKGTFDGQGHTLSGIYSKTNLATSGLFGYVQEGTVKNLQLVDSYFECTGTNATMGSIAGVGVGTFENLYSEATLVSTGQFVGGIVGLTETAKGATIQNCQYDGTMTLKGDTGYHAGGILGETYNTYVSITNCLNSGTITAEASTSTNPCIAGIIGYVYGSTNATITDTVNTGSVQTTGRTVTVGAIAGWHNGSGTFTVDNTYSLKGSSHSLGEFGDKSKVADLPESDLMYAYGYINTDLDFYDYETKTGYWTAVADGTIALKSFAKNKISTKGAIRNGDQSWYDGSGSYTISTPEQLVGFMELAKSKTFAGETITLAADIKMNDGDASTWGSKAPKNVWTPIGRTADHNTYARFEGTFNGDGHSISGIYVKSSSAQIGLFGNVNGATIKNLQLTNSYIENTTSAYDVWSGTGSIAGVAYAHLNGVYSDAIVISGADFVGGLLGGLMYNSETTITNSWFDGEVLLSGDNSMKGGGLVGGLTTGKCILTNCLNSGSVTSETVTYAPNIAGLVGYVASRQVDMTNCLNVGAINPKGNKNSVGAIVAWQTGTSAVSNVYTLDGCYTTVGEMTGDNEALVGILTLSALTGEAAKASLAGFDFYSDSNTTGIWKTVDGGTPILAVFDK